MGGRGGLLMLQMPRSCRRMYTRIELVWKDVAFEGPFTYSVNRVIYTIGISGQVILRAGRVKINVVTLGYADVAPGGARARHTPR